jgi:hypothetical protein
MGGAWKKIEDSKTRDLDLQVSVTPPPQPMDGSCDCGRVRFSTRSDRPAVIFECFCSMCPKGKDQREASGGFAWCAVSTIGSIRSSGSLVWRRSSQFAHRGRCDTCGSLVCLRYDCETHTDWVPLSCFRESASLKGVPVRRIHKREEHHATTASNTSKKRKRALSVVANIESKTKSRTNYAAVDFDEVPTFDSWQPWDPDPCRVTTEAPPVVCFYCFLRPSTSTPSSTTTTPTTPPAKQPGDSKSAEGSEGACTRPRPQRARCGSRAILPRGVCTCDSPMLERPFLEF